MNYRAPTSSGVLRSASWLTARLRVTQGPDSSTLGTLGASVRWTTRTRLTSLSGTTRGRYDRVDQGVRRTLRVAASDSPVADDIRPGRLRLPAFPLRRGMRFQRVSVLLLSRSHTRHLCFFFFFSTRFSLFFASSPAARRPPSRRRGGALVLICLHRGWPPTPLSRADRRRDDVPLPDRVWLCAPRRGAQRPRPRPRPSVTGRARPAGAAGAGPAARPVGEAQPAARRRRSSGRRSSSGKRRRSRGTSPDGCAP